MADGTHISWTDATWNIITGCSVVSPGCTNCYAMKLAGTRLKHIPSRAGLTRQTKAGPVWTGEIRFNEEWIDQPILWKRSRMIFVCAHGDLFAEGVEDEWLDSIFAVMALCPQHTFQVLTKRPERAREYIEQVTSPGRMWAHIGRLGHAAALSPDRIRAAMEKPGRPLANVLIGTSVEDQRRADERRRHIAPLSAAGWRTWVSYEPALGPVDWTGWEHVAWIVSGGESGVGARPSHPDWHRSARDFCVSHGIAYHFKQWGAFVPQYDADIDPNYWASEPGDFSDHAIDGGWCFGRHSGQRPWMMFKRHKNVTGRLLDGIEHNGFPEVRS